MDKSSEKKHGENLDHILCLILFKIWKRRSFGPQSHNKLLCLATLCSGRHSKIQKSYLAVNKSIVQNTNFMLYVWPWSSVQSPHCKMCINTMAAKGHQLDIGIIDLPSKLHDDWLKTELDLTC